jgi:hypothetical protein
MNIPMPPCSTDPCPSPSGPEKTPHGMNNRRYEFTQLHAHGGNYTRILSFADVNTVERTKKLSADPYNLIGNYHGQQALMMETDKDITTLEDNSIFTTWCLQTYGFADNPSNDYNDVWDINPYKYELGHSTVSDFFTAGDCQRFFKNKLRYYQARWGYSAAIGMYQLMSEIDDFGSTPNGISPYRTPGYNYAPLGEYWQDMMSEYIKSIYPNHLISASYAADPTGKLIDSETVILCKDMFIKHQTCDIVSCHPYGIVWVTLIFWGVKPSSKEFMNSKEEEFDIRYTS